MKRLCKIAVYTLTGFALGCLPGVAVGETRVPSRTINLVYDDSGSMIRQGNAYVDTWCQAKYALEVVAAMLDERDTLNVYYMSDYDTGTQSGPRITLRGGGGQASVDRIHSTITSFGNTPFNAVRRAHADLKKARSDERWLVVLTDGAFEDGRMESREVVSYFESVTAGDAARVMMLAMGPEAASIEPQESRGIYVCAGPRSRRTHCHARCPIGRDVSVLPGARRTLDAVFRPESPRSRRRLQPQRRRGHV